MHRIQLAPQAVELSIKRRGRVQPYVSLDPGRTALLVVDLQTGFVAPGAIAEIPVAREIVPNVNRLAAALRRSGGLVVWVISTYGPDAARDWPSFFHHVTAGEPSERFRLSFDEGRPEHALWHELDRQPADLVVPKNRMTPFADPGRRLEHILRDAGVDTVLVTGTVTNVCCESTARDAAQRDFKTIMVSDANASRNDEEHNATLSIFLQAFGGVLSTAEIVGMLDASMTGPRDAHAG